MKNFIRKFFKSSSNKFKDSTIVYTPDLFSLNNISKKETLTKLKIPNSNTSNDNLFLYNSSTMLIDDEFTSEDIFSHIKQRGNSVSKTFKNSNYDEKK